MLFCVGLLVHVCSVVKAGRWTACVNAWHSAWLVVTWRGLCGLCVFVNIRKTVFCDRRWRWLCGDLRSGVRVEVSGMMFICKREYEGGLLVGGMRWCSLWAGGCEEGVGLVVGCVCVGGWGGAGVPPGVGVGVGGECVVACWL